MTPATVLGTRADGSEFCCSVLLRGSSSMLKYLVRDSEVLGRRWILRRFREVLAGVRSRRVMPRRTRLTAPEPTVAQAVPQPAPS